MLNFLPYALAAYGGYKGYKASKDAGGSGLQRLLAGATGAYLGYQGGKMVPGVQEAGFTPFTKIPAVQSLGASFPALSGTPMGGGDPNMITGGTMGRMPVMAGTGDIATPMQFRNMANVAGPNLVNNRNINNVNNQNGVMDIFNKLFRRKRFVDDKFTGEMEFSPSKVAAAIAAGTYLGGAFEPKPIDVYTPTYNLGVAELQKQRGGFKYIDPITGEEKTFDQPYIPEAGRDPLYTAGPIELSKNTFNTGGLASIPKYNQGGINFLPSKVTHDENDSNNYVRAQGYVEDGSGTGDKDKDTMLAQLADGEFVTRADGVLGAGIIAGANPESFKDMREKGASYFYEQQKRYKRVFDLLKGSRDAKAKAN